MARKKPMQCVPLEERQEFLALVEELANVPTEQFAGIAMQCAEKYHDAVLAGHVEVLDQMESAYSALVYKLNGETMLGCMADANSSGHVLARAVAAKPGQVPRWGQAGEFLLEVEGVRVWVVMTHDMLGNHRACDLHAVDLDKPFISETGYRSAGLTVASSIGETVDQAARRMVLDVIRSEGKLKSIEADAWARKSPKKLPAWLVDALAGVRSDGQMTMFGDSTQELEGKGPLSNKDRQKLFRQRKKEKEAALKAEGVRSVLLSVRDRTYLAAALDYYEFVTYAGSVRGDYVKENLLDLYRRIDPPYNSSAAWPRDEDRPAWYSRQIWHQICASSAAKLEKANAELVAARAEVERLQAALQLIAAEVGAPLPELPTADPVMAERAEPEAFSLELMRLHKWQNGREEDVALVGIQVVPHEGRWMWSAELCASNGSGCHYAASPKWGRFSATAQEALQNAIGEVREFAPRATKAEQKRIAAWLAGEVAERLKEAGK